MLHKDENDPGSVNLTGLCTIKSATFVTLSTSFKLDVNDTAPKNKKVPSSSSVKSKNDDHYENERPKVGLEVRGIEPLTFCMQSRRSAN
jgi:hypothetical protein